MQEEKVQFKKYSFTWLNFIIDHLLMVEWNIFLKIILV